jgi:hypothetical protein
MSTFSCLDIPALRIFTSMSATGSDILLLPSYQLDFVTPGISPSFANFLKQSRHISNFRRKPLWRPHIRHRFTFLVLYFGVLCAFIIIAFLAIYNLTINNSVEFVLTNSYPALPEAVQYNRK